MDNAATSFPKPRAVTEAMVRYATELGASAGRGAYPEAVETGATDRRMPAAAQPAVPRRAARAFHLHAQLLRRAEPGHQGADRPGASRTTRSARTSTTTRSSARCTRWRSGLGPADARAGGRQDRAGRSRRHPPGHPARHPADRHHPRQQRDRHGAADPRDRADRPGGRRAVHGRCRPVGRARADRRAGGRHRPAGRPGAQGAARAAGHRVPLHPARAWRRSCGR